MFAAALARASITEVPPPAVIPNFNNVQLLLRGAGTGVQNQVGARQNEGTVWGTSAYTFPTYENYVIWTPYTNLGKFPAAPDDGVRSFTSQLTLLQPSYSVNMNYGPWTLELWAFMGGTDTGVVGKCILPVIDTEYTAAQITWEADNIGGGVINGQVRAFLVAGFTADNTQIGNTIEGNINIPSSGAWVHIALVTDGPYGTVGSKVYLFLNGILKQQTNFYGFNPDAPDSSISVPQSDASITLQYEGSSTGLITYNAYRACTGLRYIRQALTTANFSPPTAKVNNTQVGWNTLLPVGQTSTTALTGACKYVNNFIGASSTNDLGVIDLSLYGVTPGNPNAVGIVSSTSVVKYATPSVSNSSVFLSGTNQWLLSPQSVPFGTGAWTVEFAIRVSTAKAVGIVGLSFSNSNTASWGIELNASNQFLFKVGTTTILTVTSTPLVLNTWYHIAFVRNANIISLYVNGSVPAGGTVTTTLNSNLNILSPLYIGCTRPTTGVAVPTSSNFNGYLQDLRITTGVAVYTSGFTPPTEPLPSM
jgi:hypothetical protein